MNTTGGKTILISPLNWGFGHAGRMIPLALELQRRGNKIIFGAEPSMIPMLKKELPEITLIAIPGLRIRYSLLLPQFLCILFQLPLIIITSIRENLFLKHHARELKPDIIISDNRFGFFHKSIRSVYVTHMIRIPFPKPFCFLEPLGVWLHRRIINKYDLCLIPDFPGDMNLSGRLSHSVRLPANACFFGPLSRFEHASNNDKESIPGRQHYCLIASGPEPQRSRLVEKIIPELPGKNLTILTGTALMKNFSRDNVTVIINPDTKSMREVISSSSTIISRAGYSTVMELFSLEKAAVIIPTPGQTEQEYLGDYLHGRYGFITLTQRQIGSIGKIDAVSERPLRQTMQERASLFDDGLARLFEKKIKG